jgi:hypothetical protein
MISVWVQTTGSKGEIAMKRALVLACVAAAVVAGCSSDDSGAASDPYASARQLCLETTNAYRAQVGAAPLVRNTPQEYCTDAEAKSDFESGKAHGAFQSCKESAQNECPHWSGTPEDVVKNCLAMMFAEGPGEPYSAHGHYINMTNTKYTQVTCGFYVSGGSIQMVQNFW